ncbi:exodeoxyribonuclease VII small subunit [Phycisphaerales bacterium AB-hyl4]|uniref:Exodeoxyribonuclease 7 small subunit n=1 Tax=Natronomicrosphaera hydrolytica TaxID=3242702 RepID=A0ABV4U0X1_9BACT
MSKRPNIESLKFDEAMDRLETLVEQIESGEVGLEEALAQYEHGIALIKRCRTVLNAAEQRIAELTTNADGQLKVDGEQIQTIDDDLTDEQEQL